MALNQRIYFANPTRSRTYGLTDTIREDGYAYSTLYTVVSTETCKITDGNFAINYYTTDAGYYYVKLTINSLKITLYQAYTAATTRVYTRFTLGDLGLSNIPLKTGDTIKIEFVYTTGIAAPSTSKIDSLIVLDDLTAS